MILQRARALLSCSRAAKQSSARQEVEGSRWRDFIFERFFLSRNEEEKSLFLPRRSLIPLWTYSGLWAVQHEGDDGVFFPRCPTSTTAAAGGGGQDGSLLQRVFRSCWGWILKPGHVSAVPLQSLAVKVRQQTRCWWNIYLVKLAS